MFKTLLSTLIILFSIQLSYGQLSVSTNSMSVALEEGVDTEFTFYITNTSSEPATVKWIRTVNLPSDWITFVCDTEQCYLPTTDEAIFVMAPGEEAPLKVTFRATTLTSGSFVLDIFDVDDTSDEHVVTFNVTSFPVSTADIDVENIKIYPNPASDYIKISNPEGIEMMELYNLIGKRVSTFNVGSSNSTFNISDLPKGMYLIRLLDDANEVLTTKRISKR
ncbi:MAG: hypothetical protein ACI94Y_002849 [Maribacter sp.]|jgi:hypothetical protein